MYIKSSYHGQRERDLKYLIPSTLRVEFGFPRISPSFHFPLMRNAQHSSCMCTLESCEVVECYVINSGEKAWRNIMSKVLRTTKVPS